MSTDVGETSGIVEEVSDGVELVYTTTVVVVTDSGAAIPVVLEKLIEEVSSAVVLWVRFGALVKTMTVVVDDNVVSVVAETSDMVFEDSSVSMLIDKEVEAVDSCVISEVEFSEGPMSVVLTLKTVGLVLIRSVVVAFKLV